MLDQDSAVQDRCRVEEADDQEHEHPPPQQANGRELAAYNLSTLSHRITLSRLMAAAAT
jgi:hypothetical protein